MKKENGFPRPEQEGNSFLYLVKSLSNRPDAMEAQKQLIGQIIDHPYYDPIVHTLDQAQQTILGHIKKGNNPEVSHGITFVNNVLLETNKAIENSGEGKLIQMNFQTLSAIDRIQKQSTSISTFLEKLKGERLEPGDFFMVGYYSVTNLLARYADDARKERRKVGVIEINPIPKNAQERKQRDEDQKLYQDWLSKVDQINSINEDTHYQRLGMKNDEIVDLIFSEPPRPLAKKNLFREKSYAGVTFEDITKMPDPLPPEKLDQITSYVRGKFSRPQVPQDEQFMTRLFFSPTFFHSEIGPENIRHKKFSVR